MLLIDFGHPISDAIKMQVENLVKRPITYHNIEKKRFVDDRPFKEQLEELFDAAPLKSIPWEQADLIINLPTFSPIVATVLAEINGRSGKWPAILRMRPVADALVQTFELAEIINLGSIRSAASFKRT